MKRLTVAFVVGAFVILAALPAAAVSNPIPTAVDDTAATQIGQSVTIYALANDSDSAGGALRIISTNLPAHHLGSWSIAPDGQTIDYVPGDCGVGTDTFKYTIANDEGATASAHITVTVTGPACLSTPGDITVGEGVGYLTLIATKTPGTWSVDVVPGTATVLRDYAVKGIRSGHDRIKIAFLIRDDGRPEPDETFFVQWTGVVVTTTTVTIRDND